MYPFSPVQEIPLRKRPNYQPENYSGYKITPDVFADVSTVNIRLISYPVVTRAPDMAL